MAASTTPLSNPPPSPAAPQTKTITFVGGAVPPLSYGALIVATGAKLPLFAPTPGDTLLERATQVQATGAAIASANTVIINGSGLIGLEMAGDVRASNATALIIILARDGSVLKMSHPAKMQVILCNVYTYICMYVYIYTNTYIYICIFIYICMYI